MSDAGYISDSDDDSGIGMFEISFEFLLLSFSNRQKFVSVPISSIWQYTS